jgi:uncharacterized membrane protein
MAEPISSTGNTTGIPANIAAALCAIFTLLGGIIFYCIEKKDTFVRHWAVQSIFFGGTWFAFNIGMTLLISAAGVLPVLHFVLVPSLVLLHALIHIVLLVFWFIGIIKALQGERWEYPFVSAQCRRLFPTLVP